MVLALLFFGVVTVFGYSQTLSIYCEENAPFQFTDANKNLKGLSVELVQAIQKRVGNTDPIEVAPWARGYGLIQSDSPNVVLFSMARNKARNPLFQWVGPLTENNYALYSRADSKLSIKSLEDAKNVAKIGVVLNDVRDQFLTSAGFSNLDRSADYVTSLKKMLNNRTDLVVLSVVGSSNQLADVEAKPSDVKQQFVFLRAQLWIAFSKTTDKAIVQKWIDAFEALKKDGTCDAIYKKYGEFLRPGVAVTTF